MIPARQVHAEDPMDQDRDANAPDSDGEQPNPLSLNELPRWKKLLLLGAGLFLLIGLALMPFESGSDLSKTQGVTQTSDQGSGGGAVAANNQGSGEQGTDQGANALAPSGAGLVPQGTGPEGGNTLVPGSVPRTGGAEPASAEGGGSNLSPAFMKMGFSFFVGFAIGLAFRTLLRLALIFIGLQLAVLFGLEQIDWIAIDVEAMKRSFDAMTGNLKSQFESFQTFLTGRLPQAGLASLGLYTGFKKS